VPDPAPEQVVETAWNLLPLFALAGVLAGMATWRLVGMWVVDRLLSGWELSAILIVFGTVFAGAVGSPGVARITLLVVHALMSLAVLVMPAASQRARRRRMERKDIERYEAMLRRQPDVAFPHRKLGEIYQARGDWERAIEQYEAYLALHDTSAEIAQKLEHCLEVKRRIDLGLQRCPWCGVESPREESFCPRCGRYLGPRLNVTHLLGEPLTQTVMLGIMLLLLVAGTWRLILAPATPVVGMVMLGLAGVLMIALVYGRLRG